MDVDGLFSEREKYIVGSDVDGGRIVVRDVLVGEVWLCSGQSNMEMPLKKTIGAETEAASASGLPIRQFLVANNASGTPQEDCQGKWVIATPDTVGEFTAVGYYFAKKLTAELKVPVGLVHSSWGGTPIESWISAEALDTLPEIRDKRLAIERQIAEYPEKKQEYVTGFGKWLKEQAREDKPCSNPAAFTGDEVAPEGWTTVKLPGEVAGSGLPATGAIWVRKEIDLPGTPSTRVLQLGIIEGFDSVYWNGHLVKQLTYENLPGAEYARSWGPYYINASIIRPGRNVLAIRIFAPAVAPRFKNDPKIDTIPLRGEWQAKSEYEFEPLHSGTPAAPVPPLTPSEAKNTAAYLFNGKIHPLLQSTIRGALWYQGESNVWRAWQYRTLFSLLITDWRTRWHEGNFSFYFCQLANFDQKASVPGESCWAELRESQSSVLRLPKTGQAVLIDTGESEDVHARDKKDAGERLGAVFKIKGINI